QPESSPEQDGPEARRRVHLRVLQIGQASPAQSAAPARRAQLGLPVVIGNLAWFKSALAVRAVQLEGHRSPVRAAADAASAALGGSASSGSPSSRVSSRPS